MDAIKNVAKDLTGSSSQFSAGHQIPISHQTHPGLEAHMSPSPQSSQLPSSNSDSGYESYKPAQKLLGKRALITGGDSGIGRAIAILFAMEGVEKIFITYLPEEAEDAKETRKRIEQKAAVHGVSGTPEVVLFPTDLSDRGNCRRVVEVAVERMGGIDILVNNAAYQKEVQDILDLPEDQWLHTFNVNIHPYFYLSKYSIPHMPPGSTILNTSSINAYIGHPNLLDYTSTKGAIIAFTRALSNQLLQAKKGIRVNAVCPGPVWTPLIPSTMSSEAQDKFSETPMGRPGQPSEIATCFVFLASTDSALISGQCLHPNGGTVLNG